VIDKGVNSPRREDGIDVCIYLEINKYDVRISNLMKNKRWLYG
jgi:hypothetical protein